MYSGLREREGGRQAGTRDVGVWCIFSLLGSQQSAFDTCLCSYYSILIGMVSPTFPDIYLCVTDKRMVTLPIHLESFSFFLDYCIDFSEVPQP